MFTNPIRQRENEKKKRTKDGKYVFVSTLSLSGSHLSKSCYIVRALKKHLAGGGGGKCITIRLGPVNYRLTESFLLVHQTGSSCSSVFSFYRIMRSMNQHTMIHYCVFSFIFSELEKFKQHLSLVLLFYP